MVDRSIARLRPALGVVVALMAALIVPVLSEPGASAAAGVPSGFSDSAVITGLDQPTGFRFAPDGHVFVLEKTGRIKIFKNIDDANPTVYDMSAEVHSWWDRGLLGIALDPDLTTAANTQSYIYVLYTYDVNHFGGANCPGGTPPGDGCTALGRLSRLTVQTAADGTTSVVPGSELVLVTNWCIQYNTHSIGTVAFGPDGKLYAGGGEGAGAEYGGTQPDVGQYAGNPCGGPSGYQGSLRSQSFRSSAATNASSYWALDGTIIRINKDGTVPTDNPNAGLSFPKNLIVAYGLRNHYRWTFKPGTSEIWSGDVGGDMEEEIDQINPLASPTQNLGWPCYEGYDKMPSSVFQTASTCTALYSTGTARAPWFAYQHSGSASNACALATSGAFFNASVTGTAFYQNSGSNWPASYNGGMFFADYSRGCIWFAPAGAGGTPNAGAITTFTESATAPVDLQSVPQFGGDLFYTNIITGARGADGQIAVPGPGELRRIRYVSASNNPPVANATFSNDPGNPLTVRFDASTSHDTDGQIISYAWDFGDGWSGTGVAPQHTYATGGRYTARLTVTDNGGLGISAPLPVTAGGPAAQILTPTTDLVWQPHQTIAVTGTATDSRGVPLGGSSLHWHVNIFHCEGASCHRHFDVVAPATGAAWSFTAPDHGSATFKLEIVLTATDGDGLSSTVTRTIIPNQPHLGVAPSELSNAAYRLVARDGGIFAFGGASFHGSTGAIHLAQPIVGGTATPSADGYWLVASDGGIFAFGDAKFAGSTGAIHLAQPIVGMTATPTGNGYWLVASDGGIFAFGDAKFAGSTGAIHLAQPIVGMTATPTGNGYWLVASDGGIFAFGDAKFAGSTGAIHLARPIVGMTATPTGNGYWLVASDGGIFAFGDAKFQGSTGAIHLARPIVGMTATPTGNGYWLVASDGGIFAFGDAKFQGSTGAIHLAQPIVGMMR
ncbi:MAG: PQQ-dependent sugar dehydrogenase [Acidimicrobiia bacterium]